MPETDGVDCPGAAAGFSLSVSPRSAMVQRAKMRRVFIVFGT